MHRPVGPTYTERGYKGTIIVSCPGHCPNHLWLPPLSVVMKLDELLHKGDGGADLHCIPKCPFVSKLSLTASADRVIEF